MNKQMPEEYYKLLLDLQTVDFVLVELNLYLDTHPTDRKSIEQYNYYAHKKELLKKQFNEKFGPLQGFGNSYSRDSFEWGEAPWPWQV
ncbi:spore coat protein CotJB [Tumebacillus algifaecis]|uniref:Spore coat protein CotJB n=1 Tax=Tumebacillus algifaecis TaxID=1214604 RepID=A0A223D4D4_9BACL|nr:spore coat protein CotJB [Tumebacillus algifaecis]ASS76224.1 spore coat protein CotJB [Tumebacillus algifaecis]